MRALILTLAVCCAGQAFAQDPVPCREQLETKAIHDNWLAKKRAEVEERLAEMATEANKFERQVKALEKENTALKEQIKQLQSPQGK